MPTPRVHFDLYNCIVESYHDIGTLISQLCDPLGITVKHKSVDEATAELINSCKYYGVMPQLIKRVADKCPDPSRGKAFKTTLTVANKIAVSITHDVNDLIRKIPELELQNAEFLHEVVSNDSIGNYHVKLANTLDHCGSHVIIVGDPKKYKTLPLPFEIENYCVFFWDLPTYFLIPKNCEEDWRSRTCPMITRPQLNWPQRKILVYLDDTDLLTQFGDLLWDLRDQTPLREKIVKNEFDVFLCYNSTDRPAVIEIGKKLKQRGILPWLDEWELRPGLPWQRALEEQIGKVKSAAVFVGQNGIGPWQDMEQAAFLRQFVKRACPVIPVLLPDCPEKPKLPIFLENMQWVDFRKSDPDPMEQLIWGITGKGSQK